MMIDSEIWEDDGQDKGGDDRDRKIPGKLKNPFDGQDKGGNDRERKIPGKLKNPFNEQKGKDDRNKNRKTGVKGRDTTGEIEGSKEKPKNIEQDVQDKNKLLTYLSLATEPEAFQTVFADAQPEILSFFSNLNQAYKPVIDKILEDKANKMNELNNKNLLGKADKGDSPTIIEPFNLNSLPEKEKYDEGVVLSLAKLYNYILDHPIPEELNNKLDGKEGKNGEGGEEEAPVNNLTYGILSPNDPNNNEFVNNLEVMADPVYNPDNYIFVKQFNDQMDNIMNKLGKYEEEPSPEEEKLEIRENYLSHLNTLFKK